MGGSGGTRFGPPDCATSPLAVPGSYGVTRYHYSVLRTIQDGFGLRPYLGRADEVMSIDDIWA